MAENEKTVRSRGERLRTNEVKTEIIRFILSKNDVVPGPDIIKHIQETYNIVDEKNIRIHLRDLQKQRCIEKIKGESGLKNKWKIEKIESLQSIREHYPEIQLNKYEKSLMIVLQKNGYDIFTFRGIQFYIKLFLSSSFFNECIGTDINTLLERGRGIYAYENPLEAQRIKYNFIDSYSFYKNKYPTLNISYELFESTMTQISQRKISPTKLSQRERSRTELSLLSRNASRKKHYAEEFMKIWEIELLRLPKEKLDEMHREIKDTDLDLYWEMYIEALEIREFNSSFETQRFDLLFGYFVKQDIFKGVASEEETDFAIKTKANEEESRKDDFSEYLREDESGATTQYMMDKSLEDKILSDLEQASKILAKYKHPSVFGNIYDNPTGTFYGILEIFRQGNELANFIPYYEEERTIFLMEEQERILSSALTADSNSDPRNR